MSGPFLKLMLTVAFLICSPRVFAQAWMSGFQYRKKITVDKSKVKATFISSTTVIYEDLIDFPILIMLESDDLKFDVDAAENKITDILGRDISFALSGSPTVPLSFQLDSYDPVKGKLSCWVRIPSLSADRTWTPATVLYFYYGAAVLHDPRGAAALGVWTGAYHQVWHMEDSGDSKIGRARTFNGSTDRLRKEAHVHTPSVTLSAWVKWQQNGMEQMIVANDTAGRAGYKLWINSAGQIVFEGTVNASTSWSLPAGTTVLMPGLWYYVCAKVDYSGSVGSAALMINGVLNGGRSGASVRFSAGAQVSAGASKQNDRFFKGAIDELRIGKNARPNEWLQTEYLNQSDPASFYLVGAEEFNSTGYAVFTGAKSNLFSLAGNWIPAVVPSGGTNILVSAGKSMRINNPGELVFGKLYMEQGASVATSANVRLSGAAKMAAQAVFLLDEGAAVSIEKDLICYGRLDGAAGKLIFKGNPGMMKVSSGSISVKDMELNMAAVGDEVLLKSEVKVNGTLNLLSGGLNANGFLTLGASSEGAARVLPVRSPENVQVKGNVHVQNYIAGDYPSPATARGWKLLSSPVFQTTSAEAAVYGFREIQQRVFVTGKGGVLNGFDASPGNGATIYSHDQALPGTLSQKYVPISSMDTHLPLGKGFYLFSRGDRSGKDAYRRQIQDTPFVKPAGYVITFTGRLFAGELKISCSSSDLGGIGDGFNLMGNPYAADISWGKLIKENLQDAVWLYDPLNGAYVVSNDPTTVISPGAGFFVRVKTGFKSGSLTFTEDAKTGVVPESAGFASSRMFTTAEKSDAVLKQLKVTLVRGVFSQPLLLRFTTGGHAGIGNGDAVKVGEGYVGIAGLAADETRLSIDDRSDTISKQEVLLYVKGYENGEYRLKFDGLSNFNAGMRLSIKDNYLKTERVLSAADTVLVFAIDNNVPESFGDRRFVLVLKRAVPELSERNSGLVVLYPNPFEKLLYIKLNLLLKAPVVWIADLKGRKIWSARFNAVLPGDILKLEPDGLPQGTYVIWVEEAGRPIGDGMKLLKL